METNFRATSPRRALRAALRPVALIMALGAGPALAAENGLGDTLSDAALTTEVKARLMANDVTRGININVDTNDGMVTLRGTVPSEQAKQKAAEIALAVKGADSVTNALVVGDSSANPQTLTAKTKKAGQQAGEAISDGWITTQVKTRLLADDEIKGLDINVSTSDGQVVLAGLAPSEEIRDKIIVIAHRVEGVHSVNARALQVEDSHPAAAEH
jgi:osmotically-inducible protein OsmY